MKKPMKIIAIIAELFVPAAPICALIYYWTRPATGEIQLPKLYATEAQMAWDTFWTFLRAECIILGFLILEFWLYRRAVWRRNTA